eukprot:6486697-Amphidinium_carterae.1
MKEDVHRLQKDRERNRQSKGTQPSATTAHPPSSTSSASAVVTGPVTGAASGSASSGRTFNPKHTTGMPQNEARAYLPPKATLTKDSTENRWKLWSPWQGGSGYISKSFGARS